MSGAIFSVSRTDGPMCSTGIDNIEFMVSLNKGETVKPLVNVASGGELSRIMLAIKSVLGENDSVGTLIFDEIDAGVSGRAAEKIGIKLKSISKNTQIICITHLAQIACLADNHYLIDKTVSGDRTFTQVKSLDEQGRTYELARIMGGTNITNEMLESAKQMLTLR
jgi:DNA repair protein RecN (Recombination protein N)